MKKTTLYAIKGDKKILVNSENTRELAKKWYKFEYWFSKEQKLENLRKLFDEKINNFLESYPKGIRETFPLREKEAKKYIEEWYSDYLESLVSQKNIDRANQWLVIIDVSDFAEKIIEKAGIFKTAYNKLESWYDLEKENILKN